MVYPYLRPLRRGKNYSYKFWYNKKFSSQAWHCVPIVPATQEVEEGALHEADLSNLASHYLKEQLKCKALGSFSTVDKWDRQKGRLTYWLTDWWIGYQTARPASGCNSLAMCSVLSTGKKKRKREGSLHVQFFSINWGLSLTLPWYGELPFAKVILYLLIPESTDLISLQAYKV